MDLVLVRVQSDGQAKAAPIDRPRTVLGRQTGCQLRIGSGEVSREHCEVLLQEGSAVVRDLASRNGTFVNGVKVVEKRLEAGDLIAVGPVVFMVQVNGQPAKFDAAALYREGAPGSEPPAAPRPKAPTNDPPTSASRLVEGLGGDPDGSSVVEFDFDFEDEEEEQRSQPPL